MKTIAVIVELGELHGDVVGVMETFDEALQEMRKLQKKTGKQYQIYYSELENDDEDKR